MESRGRGAERVWNLVLRLACICASGLLLAVFSSGIAHMGCCLSNPEQNDPRTVVTAQNKIATNVLIDAPRCKSPSLISPDPPQLPVKGLTTASVYSSDAGVDEKHNSITTSDHFPRYDEGEAPTPPASAPPPGLPSRTPFQPLFPTLDGVTGPASSSTASNETTPVDPLPPGPVPLRQTAYETTLALKQTVGRRLGSKGSGGTEPGVLASGTSRASASGSSSSIQDAAKLIGPGTQITSKPIADSPSGLTILPFPSTGPERDGVQPGGQKTQSEFPAVSPPAPIMSSTGKPSDLRRQSSRRNIGVTKTLPGQEHRLDACMSPLSAEHKELNGSQPFSSSPPTPSAKFIPLNAGPAFDLTQQGTTLVERSSSIPQPVVNLKLAATMRNETNGTSIALTAPSARNTRSMITPTTSAQRVLTSPEDAQERTRVLSAARPGPPLMPPKPGHQTVEQAISLSVPASAVPKLMVSEDRSSLRPKPLDVATIIELRRDFDVERHSYWSQFDLQQANFIVGHTARHDQLTGDLDTWSIQRHKAVHQFQSEWNAALSAFSADLDRDAREQLSGQHSRWLSQLQRRVERTEDLWAKTIGTATDRMRTTIADIRPNSRRINTARDANLHLSVPFPQTAAHDGAALLSNQFDLVLRSACLRLDDITVVQHDKLVQRQPSPAVVSSPSASTLNSSDRRGPTDVTDSRDTDDRRHGQEPLKRTSDKIPPLILDTARTLVSWFDEEFEADQAERDKSHKTLQSELDNVLRGWTHVLQAFLGERLDKMYVDLDEQAERFFAWFEDGTLANHVSQSQFSSEGDQLLNGAIRGAKAVLRSRGGDIVQLVRVQDAVLDHQRLVAPLPRISVANGDEAYAGHESLAHPFKLSLED